MKHLLLLLTFCVSTSFAQVDLGVSTTFNQVYITGEVFTNFPDSQVLMGAEVGYEAVNKDVHYRFGVYGGWQVDEWLQFGLHAGLVNWTDPYVRRWGSLNPNYLQTGFVPQFRLGAKGLIGDHFYGSLEVCWPGFIELGIGLRLRPWNKLEPHRTYKNR